MVMMVVISIPVLSANTNNVNVAVTCKTPDLEPIGGTQSLGSIQALGGNYINITPVTVTFEYFGDGSVNHHVQITEWDKTQNLGISTGPKAYIRSSWSADGPGGTIVQSGAINTGDQITVVLRSSDCSAYGYIYLYIDGAKADATFPADNAVVFKFMLSIVD
jgi:hypothetical protein